MAIHEIVLKSCDTVAEGTMMFRFSKPPGFSFAAGQAVDLALVNPPAEPNSSHRLLSLVSAPFEAELAVATRMRDASAFKRALGTLVPGATVRLKRPLGVMTLHEDPARAAVFIAGGIGITPFMSMLRQAAYDRPGHRFFLLYSNRQPEQAAFLHALRSLEGEFDHFRLLARMTDQAGFIDEETIKGFTASAERPLYYLAGPPTMADAMSRILRGSGIKDEDISSEQFYGY